MILDALFLAVSLFLVVQGATLATKYATRLAERYRLSRYTVGFIVVAIISILPETFIAINSARAGIPAFGLATLFGSNIADLTLVFAIVALLSGRDIKVESKILKNNSLYPFLLLLPLVLGLDGYYSRLEGAALIIAGIVFYYTAFQSGHGQAKPVGKEVDRFKTFLWLLLGMAMLLIGSELTVSSASSLAHAVGINPILIGMLVVGLGTTMPEMFFSLKSLKKKHDALAVGDILGTVLADATIVVGILALISPFAFPPAIIYITGAFMVLAAFILFSFLRSDRTLTRKEGLLLFLFWLLFVAVQFISSVSM